MNFFNKTILIISLVFSIFSGNVYAEEALAAAQSSTEQANQLASELADLKQQVLTLNRELFILEEDLLFPASTQVAVFVSVDIGRFFVLDSVELKLNEQESAGFLYTDKQRKSLEQGGIQRLYQGNLKEGEHELTAIFYGVDNEGRSIKRAVTYPFTKEDEAIMLELKLEDNTSKYQADIVVEEWIL